MLNLTLALYNAADLSVCKKKKWTNKGLIDEQFSMKQWDHSGLNQTKKNTKKWSSFIFILLRIFKPTIIIKSTISVWNWEIIWFWVVEVMKRVNPRNLEIKANNIQLCKNVSTMQFFLTISGSRMRVGRCYDSCRDV